MTIENEDISPDAIDQNITDLMNAFEEADIDIDKRAEAVCRYTHVEVNLMLAQALQDLMDVSDEVERLTKESAEDKVAVAAEMAADIETDTTKRNLELERKNTALQATMDETLRMLNALATNYRHVSVAYVGFDIDRVVAQIRSLHAFSTATSRTEEP